MEEKSGQRCDGWIASAILYEQVMIYYYIKVDSWARTSPSNCNSRKPEIELNNVLQLLSSLVLRGIFGDP